MTCPDCDTAQVRLEIPSELREHAPESGDDDVTAIAVCTRCLRIEPATGDAEMAGEPREISDALPADEASAVALLLAVEKLSSITRNREGIEVLLGHSERAGVDYRLVLERLGTDPDLEPAVDIGRRIRQFEQLS